VIFLDEIKRLNLSFNLQRENDRIAYNIIRSKRQKTAYIIKAILAYEGVTQEERELIRIKRALREVIKEMKLTADKHCDFTEESQIPDEVFQIFDSI
jgi:3-methyladenine DNA glycosylase AlkC